MGVSKSGQTMCKTQEGDLSFPMVVSDFDFEQSSKSYGRLGTSRVFVPPPTPVFQPELRKSYIKRILPKIPILNLKTLYLL